MNPTQSLILGLDALIMLVWRHKKDKDVVGSAFMALTPRCSGFAISNDPRDLSLKPELRRHRLWRIFL